MSNAEQEKAIYWLAHLESPDLTEEEQAAFFEWLEASPKHQLAYFEAEKLWQKGALPQAQPRQSAATEQTTGWFGFPLVTASAALVVIVGAVFAYQKHSQPDIYLLELTTEKGQQLQQKLQDGSEVILNTASKISVTYGPDSREVRLLAGEVMFKVTKDQARPFDVVTENGRVRVLGTQFIVREKATESLVTVIEGRVGVSDAAELSGVYQQKALLTANQQSAISKDGVSSPVEVEADHVGAWQAKQLIFKSTPLKEVLQDLARYYDHQFELADPALEGKLVDAVIQINTPESSARAIASALGLSLEQPVDGVTVIGQ